jgi:cytochrome P450
MATHTTELAPGLTVHKGQVVLPSLAAALQDPTSAAPPTPADFHKGKPNWGLAFGAGANRCPFVAPSMLLLAIALEVIFTSFNLRLAVKRSQLQWQKGLLPIPNTIPVFVDHRPDSTADRTDQEKVAATAPASAQTAVQT